METALVIDETHETKAKLDEVETIRDFVLAGSARITLVSTKTGSRFTYWVRKADEKKSGPVDYFVRLLVAEHNDSANDYAYLGIVFNDGAFRVGKKSSIGNDAPSAKAFGFFWACMKRGVLHPALEVWHEGRCGACGRVLTVPESIACGIGPKCLEKLGA